MRNIQDSALVVTKALPAAAATAYTDALDLGETSPAVAVEKVEVLLTVPATPSLVDAKTIIYTFADSADNSSFTAIAELATVTSTGAASAGAAAVSQRVKLPPSVRRYVRVGATVLTAGGDNTAVSMTLAARF